MRLFIEVEIPQGIKEYIAKIQKRIGSHFAKIKYVDKENMHLTLKFLGETQPNYIENIKKSLKDVKVKSFSSYLDSISFFPSENYIRVVWIGLKPEDEIVEVQKNIDEKLKKIFKKEKNFKPHLTLGRVKFVEDKEKFMEQLKKIKIENKKFGINNFKLIKSTLSQKGPIYEDIGIFG